MSPPRAARLAALALLALLVPALGAVEVPARPAGNLTDLAGLLDPAATRRIEAAIQRLVDHDARLAVVVLDSARPRSPKEWAVEAFNSWQVGEAGRDNGVLVLLAAGDRRVEIETGYGIEPRLTDSQAGRLLDRHAVPWFRQDDWSRGLVELVEGIEAHLTQAPADYRPAPARRRPRGVPRPAPRGLALWLSLFGAMVVSILSPRHSPVVLAALWAAWAFSLPLRHRHVTTKFWLGGGLVLAYLLVAHQVFPPTSPYATPVSFVALLPLGLGFLVALYTLTRRCPRCRAGYTDVTSRTLRRATYSRGGLVEVTTTCPRCPYHDVGTHRTSRRVRSSSSSSSSWSSSSSSSSSSSWSSSSSYSSSSYSSFGGGSSGGGGAGRSF